MKRLLLTISILGSLAGPSAIAREQTILARITAYWPSGKEPQRAFSNGAKLHEGHCAVDPKKIPFGSQVIFPDTACVAVDTGPAVVSRTAARKCAKTPLQRNALVIDRYFQSKRQALAWVAAHPHFMTVRVLDPQHKEQESSQTRTAATARGSAVEAPTSGRESSPSNPNFVPSAPADVRGSLLPTFFGTALPRS